MKRFPMIHELQMFYQPKDLFKNEEGGFMQLYAGIHISDGKSVNPNDLHYLRDNILTLDPVKLALHWQELGATYLHIIDLDAAAMGYPVNGETIRNI